MEWLNYHHLHYFWVVARTGSIARASQELRLSQPTISNQLKTLEASLGHPLLERRGRGLVLTDVGRTVQRYADEIFRTGRELQQALKGVPTRERIPFSVGVADVIPKLVAERMLQSAVDAVKDLRLVCREGPLPALLASLALHELDVVLSDSPAPEAVRVKAFGHLLAECGVVFLAAPRPRPPAQGLPGLARRRAGAAARRRAPRCARGSRPGSRRARWSRWWPASSTTARSSRPSGRAAWASSRCRP